MNIFILLIGALTASGQIAWSEPSDLPLLFVGDLTPPILAPPECGDGIRFGAATACNSTLIMVSDDGRRDGPPRPGIVCTFAQYDDKWSLSDTIQNPIPRKGDEFGYALHCDRDQLIVGCPGDGMGGAPGGQAWVFRRVSERWIAESQLAPGGLPSGSRFGEAVAIYGDYAAVGTPRFDADGIWDRGRVDIFFRTLHRWTHISVLEPPHTMSSMWFGKSLRFTGPELSIFIGAPGFDTPIDRAGAVFQAKKNTKGEWNISAIIQKSTPTALGRLGMSIAGQGYLIFIGVPGSNPGREDAGSLICVGNKSTPSIIAEHSTPAYESARLGSIVKASKQWVASSMPGVRHSDRTTGQIRIYDIHAHRIQPLCEIRGRATDPPIGYAMAVSNQRLIVSGIYPEDRYPQPGCVWVIELRDLKTHSR